MYLSYLLADIGDNPDRPRPGRLWLRNLYRVHQRLCMGFPSVECKENDSSFLQPYKPERFPEDRFQADRKKTEISEDILKQVHSQRNNQSGFLFRIDPLPAGRAMIVVQSAVKPDWHYAFQNAGYLLASPPQIKPYELKFTSEIIFKFCLVANPTRRLSKKSSGSDGNPVETESIGKRVPVLAEKLEEWLTGRAERGGFIIEKGLLNIQTGYVSAPKNKDDLKRFFYGYM